MLTGDRSVVSTPMSKVLKRRKLMHKLNQCGSSRMMDSICAACFRRAPQAAIALTSVC